MKKLVLGVAAVLASAGTPALQAADWCRGELYPAALMAQYQLPDFKYSVKPAAGVFYDPSQPGTGLTLDVFQVNGADYAFVTYYHYQADGRPTWMNLVAPVQQTPSFAQYALDGIPATITGRWAETNGGQCFDCAYTGFPPVNYPPHGDRVLNVRSGNQIDLPASGQAALREMRLGRALGDGQTMKALVESGDIWRVIQRRRNPDGVVEEASGWIRFKKRDPAKKWRYVPAQATSCVDDGSGNPAPSQVPAWMNHSAATLNAIDQQYEAKCMSSTLPSTVGGCPSLIETSDELSFRTFFIDPATQRFFLKEHCIGCTTGSSFYRDNAAVTQTAEVVPSGADRLVIRGFSATSNIWVYEYELTRVPREIVSAFLPGYVFTAD